MHRLVLCGSTVLPRSFGVAALTILFFYHAIGLPLVAVAASYDGKPGADSRVLRRFLRFWLVGYIPFAILLGWVCVPWWAVVAFR